MGRRDDDDREKLSWREIDSLRNRSRHVDRDTGGFRERTLKTDWARKQHLREAEKSFQGKKGSEAYKKARGALDEKYGTSEFPGALSLFIQEFGMPDDWGLLLLILDTENADWVKQALAVMKDMAPKKSLLERKGFKGKVRVIASSTKDRVLREECEKILDTL
jgi:hypothetical protein